MSKVKPFLILQLRPEDPASDNEFAAFLDFGRLVEAEVHRVRMENDGVPDIDLDNYSGVIVGGGPYNVSDPEDSKTPGQIKMEKDLAVLLDKVIDNDFPFLGACYGLGVLAKHLGGNVSKEKYSEPVGAITVKLAKTARSDPLTSNLPSQFRAFAGHKEACQNIPPNTTLLGSSDDCPVQIIRHKKNIYATQFHTELDKKGLALRINIYKHAGYFLPDDAEKLIAKAEAEIVEAPATILSRFTTRYKQLQ
jgi:GMP synthase (glutamine-hydrolysing)